MKHQRNLSCSYSKQTILSYFVTEVSRANLSLKEAFLRFKDLFWSCKFPCGYARHFYEHVLNFTNVFWLPTVIEIPLPECFYCLAVGFLRSCQIDKFFNVKILSKRSCMHCFYESKSKFGNTVHALYLLLHEK